VPCPSNSLPLSSYPCVISCAMTATIPPQFAAYTIRSSFNFNSNSIFKSK
jgi:hypothetical protein